MPVHVYIEIYILVCIGGNYLVAYCLFFLKWLMALDTRPIVERMAFFIGFTERAVALTLFLLAPRYLAVFIGGWVLLKFALGWQRTPFVYKLAVGSQVALIGNVLSFAIAIVGGYYLRPDNIAFFRLHD
jgi:hypothetical protein